MYPPKNPWTDHDRIVVRDMLLADKSYTTIGKHFGINRNAVTGRVHRDPDLLVVVRRLAAQREQARRRKPPTKPVQPRAVPSLAAAAVPKVPAPVQPQAPAPKARDIPLHAVDRGACRWPVADDPTVVGGQRFCGAPARGTYCDHHERIARPPSAQRARRSHSAPTWGEHR
jgi:hypothetical protein